MYKRIDVDGNATPEGFSYENVHGDLEGVSVCDGYVDIGMVFGDGVDCGFSVYTDDIPKMIKALQAAYQQLTGV